MKKQFIYLFLISSFLSLGFTSCGENERDLEVKELKLSTDYIFLKLSDGYRTVDILSGNGGYKITVADALNSILEVKVEGEKIMLKPIQYEGTATLYITDKRGKQAEFRVVVDSEYILLQVAQVEPYVKTSDIIIQKEIEKEIKENDLPTTVGYIYELSFDQTKGYSVKTYKNMYNAAFEEIEKAGTFTLSTNKPELTFSFNGRDEIYEISGRATPALYTYFGIFREYNNNAKNTKNDYVSFQELHCDLTEKYKQKYPNSNIEYAGVNISAQYVFYKYVPIN